MNKGLVVAGTIFLGGLGVATWFVSQRKIVLPPPIEIPSASKPVAKRDDPTKLERFDRPQKPTPMISKDVVLPSRNLKDFVPLVSMIAEPVKAKDPVSVISEPVKTKDFAFIVQPVKAKDQVSMIVEPVKAKNPVSVIVQPSKFRDPMPMIVQPSKFREPVVSPNKAIGKDFSSPNLSKLSKGFL
jgi:hypothetical protein